MLVYPAPWTSASVVAPGHSSSAVEALVQRAADAVRNGPGPAFTETRVGEQTGQAHACRNSMPLAARLSMTGV